MIDPAQSAVFDWDCPAIHNLIRAALDEDLTSGTFALSGDQTAHAIAGADQIARAQIIAKQDLVLAGMPLAERVFRSLDPDIRVESCFAEGARVAQGSTVARMHGKARAILTAERTALNFLAHLSGVATLTHQFVAAIEGTRARIRDTRKTTPLHRHLEKYAVRMGGGTNHRMGLFDAILIKENHIALAGSVTEAIRRAHEHVVALSGGAKETTAYESFQPLPGLPLRMQVEVRNEVELREALAAGADCVLLDNVSPTLALSLIDFVRRKNPACTVEISGGVNLSNVKSFAKSGADFIAIGALTHSAPAADFSLLVDPSSVG